MRRANSRVVVAETIRPLLGLQPDDVADLPPAVLPGLLAALAALQTAVAAKLAGMPAEGRQGDPPASDGLLHVEVGARMAGVTREQFLRRQAFRPTLVKLGHRTIRVDERKLRRVLAQIGT
jgi:hypothetical protein